MKVKADDVVQYLLDNPQFFEEHAEALSNIQASNAEDADKVISFSGRQISALKDKNLKLQDKMLELINFGERNDDISTKMHRISLALMTCTSLDDLLHQTKFNLCEDFSVPHIAIRLWGISSNEGNLDQPEFTATSKDIHAIAENLTQPYCGPHVADEIKDWFGEDAAHLQSFSTITLRTDKVVGMLVLASPEAQRFNAEMETLHLKRLGELISTTLTRFIS